jgi:FkbM family methyltransferase
MLKRIRKNSYLNKKIRNTIRSFGRISTKFYDSAITNWRVSGVIDCTFGSTKFKMYSLCDDNLANIFFYNKTYSETADLNLFTTLARHSKTILDIGANTGLFSVLSSLSNTAACIYAIEPYEKNYERLNNNIQLNGLRNVFLHNIAIGSDSGTLNLSVPATGTIVGGDVVSVDGSFSKHMYPELEWKTTTVKKYSLNDFIPAIKEPIDLIKIDVETYEMSVLKGAKIAFEQKATILFESFLDDTKRNFFDDLLRENNYYAYIILETGIVRMEKGFSNINYEGLNYLISPIKSSETYISFKELSAKPGEILYRPFYASNT